jgi:predicted nucleotidyltransferase
VVAMNEIRAFVQRVVEGFRPERVLLFGSYAGGSPSPDSDVDLLVIMPHEGKAWRKAAEIRGKVQPPFPLDLLVRSPEEFRSRLNMGDVFLREIAEKGQVLYEAGNR